MMAGSFTRRRTIPPYKDDEGGLSPRDRALARIEALLREELVSPPVDEEAGPGVEPAPVDLEDVVEVARLSPPPKPLKPAAPASIPRPKPQQVSALPSSPTKTTPFHVFLQALILLFVLSWVFILGIVVGRGHLWESGPVYDLVIWLEQKAGWDKAETSPIIYVREPTEEPEDGIDWEDVRRQYGYSNSHSGGAGEVAEPMPEALSYQESRVSLPTVDGLEPGGEGSTWYAEDDSDSMTNSQWRSAASSLSNYDGPSVGYGERSDLQPIEEFDDEDEGVADLASNADDESVSVAQERPPLPQPVAVAETRTEVITPAGAAEGKYAVQVASAYEEAEAQRRLDKLRSQGFPAYYYRTSGGRYPVRVGRFVTQSEANEARSRLESLGYTGLYVSTLTD